MLKLYSVSELVDRLNNSSKIFIFGTGKRLELLQHLIDFRVFGEKAIKLLDNSRNRQGTCIYIGGRECVVSGLDEAQRETDDNTVVIITPEIVYTDIYDQITQIPDFNRCDIVCLTHVIAIESDLRGLKRKAYINSIGKQKIPKVIHYCWFGGKEIPDRYKEWMDSWRSFCPDYEIIQWNEKNYDINKNRYMKDAYDEKKWGFVPDYARLDIVNTYGGIYLDTDVEIIRNFDDLLYDNAYMGFQSDELVNLGHGFASTSDNELLHEMLEQYETLEFISKNGVLNMLPSPYYQTEVLKRNGLKLNGEQQIIKETVIYPEKMFCAKSAVTMATKILDYTHSIHHFDGSWSDDVSKTYVKRLQKDLGEYHIWKK